MPFVFKHRRPPEPWHEFRRKGLHPLLVPLYYINWLGEWTAYGLGKWSLLEVLEYAGSFSILIAVIFYFADSGDRVKQKHYQAWQVINTAQGKGGSGGRFEALQELNEDGVPLVGVDVSGAFLQGVNLPGARLHRADLHAADMREAVLKKAMMEGANLQSTNLRGGDLTSADLRDADLVDADLSGAKLHDAQLRGANLERADLRNADFSSVRDWQAIKSIRLANIHGMKSPPAGFTDWAKQHGAADVDNDPTWNRMLADDPVRQAH
jgi:uncharacterized protein YjbI with pentapeptide repeats